MIGIYSTYFLGRKQKERMIKASIIIPCKSNEQNISRALLSVAQEELNNEILIGLDGHNESTENLILGFQLSNVKLIIFPEATGISKILNSLIQRSQGEYIVRMDADDISYPSRLRYQIELLDSMPDVHMLCGNASNFIGESIGRGASRQIACSELLRLNSIIHPTVVFRNLLFSQNSKFLYGPWYKKSQDYELWTRIVRKHKIFYDDKPILIYNSSLELKKYTIQHYYFSIANVKNLVWHVNPFNNCNCSSKEIILAIVASYTLFTAYLKVLIRYNRDKR
jgi:glycosyltransferase involved in cell wall biosynthesis